MKQRGFFGKKINSIDKALSKLSKKRRDHTQAYKKKKTEMKRKP